MIRKLSQLGSKAYYVTLPKHWVEQNNLSRKTDLYITEEGKGLVINTEQEQEELEKTVVINDEDRETIEAKILDLYRNGFKQVRFRFKKITDNTFLEIAQLMEDLPGIEIEIGQDFIRLAENYDNNLCEQSIKKSLQNIFVMCEMLKVKNKSKTWKEEFNKYNKKAVFLTEFALRIINRETYAPVKKIQKQLYVIWTIQQLSEKLKKIEGEKSIRMKKAGTKIELQSRNVYKSYFGDDSNILMC